MDRDAGLDGTALLVRADRDADRIDTASVHEASQEQAGHSGTTLLWFSKESRFFGQRQIQLLLWRLKQSGLRTRT